MKRARIACNRGFHCSPERKLLNDRPGAQLGDNLRRVAAIEPTVECHEVARLVDDHAQLAQMLELTESNAAAHRKDTLDADRTDSRHAQQQRPVGGLDLEGKLI